MRRVDVLLVAGELLLATAIPPLQAQRAEASHPPAAPLQNRNAPPSACSATVRETASPSSLTRCDQAAVTVTLGVTCPARLPLHAVLVIGRHLAMEDHLDQVKTAARAAVSELDFAADTRMGVISLSTAARTELDMTDRKSAVLAAINRIELDPVNPFDNQRYFDWLGEAQTMLEKERKGAGSPVEAIIVYSTGCPSQFEAYCTRQVGSANKAKGMGITVIGVCNPQARPFGFPVLPEGHCRSLQQAASPGYYHPLQEGIKVSEDLRGLFHAGDGLKLAGLTLTEWLGPGVSLVPGSAVPSPRIAGPQLTFEWGELLPGQTVTTTYRVAPTSTGQLPLRTNDSRVTFEDSLDRGPDPLPVPSRVLTVTECALLPTPTAPPTLEPTPSPTESPLPTPTQPAATATPAPSATATATATSVPGVVFLPVALRGVCKPGLTPVDVVLAIDASTSMLDPSAGTTKIAAAQEAARRFIQLLDARRDHAAIVAFNAEARLAQVLTGDKVALERAVNAIRPEPGTRIDLAVALGASELASPRGQPGGTRVLVLMSDGRSDGSTADAALAAANAAKQAGVSLYTIGLGDDVDDALLRQMASGPTTYFQAPDAAALAAIYEGVARALPCPGGVEWAPDQFGHPLKYGWSTSSQ